MAKIISFKQASEELEKKRHLEAQKAFLSKFKSTSEEAEESRKREEAIIEEQQHRPLTLEEQLYLDPEVAKTLKNIVETKYEEEPQRLGK